MRPDKLELVDLRRYFGGGEIGLGGNGFADHVDHEFAGLFDVAQGVFALAGLIGCRLDATAGQNSTVGGAEPTPVKKLKGARLAMPSAVDGGDQRNGPRHDDAGHQLVDLALLAVGGVEAEHGACVTSSSRSFC